MQGKKEKILFDTEKINCRIKELAAEIKSNYIGKDILVICLLRGGFMFCTELVKELGEDVEIDFMTTSSYHDCEESSGKVEMLHMPRVSFQDRHVIIVDDIMDSGNTLIKVKKFIESNEPKSVEIAVLLDKPERRKVDIEPDYCCFEVPNVFVVGFGLDYKNFHRNKPYIFTYE